MARVMLDIRAEEERLTENLVIQRRRLREGSLALYLPEPIFIRHFRLSKTQFVRVCEEICPYLQTRRKSAVAPALKILAALAYYANGSKQLDIGTNAYLNICETTIRQCIHEITEVLNNPQILMKFIKFPRSQSERLAVMRTFYEKFGMPGTIGIADGTHVALKRPTSHEEAYFNRKLYHSLNALIICDANLKILHVDASFGGASHDSHIWNLSPVQAMLQRLHSQGETCWLLGDSGYPQRPWMMTPILNASSGSPEEHFTRTHTRCRSTVERCIGVLKSRWRCLMAHQAQHYSPPNVAKIVNACVVLHNFLIDDRGFPIEPDMRRDIERQIVTSAADDQTSQSGVQQRHALVNRLWQNRSH